jgi:hypothetical protein
MISEFPHKSPKGYSYEFKQFKRNIIAIWICDHRRYVYNNGTNVSCIWGFYNQKTKEYYSPINSSTIGSVVDILNTTPYSAVHIHKTALELAFV